MLTKAIKYLLFIFNFIFVLTGLSLIIVGALVKSETDKYMPVVDEDYNSTSNLLIFLGCFIFVVSFFGCCGSLKENQCMILTFSVIMAAIFIAEISVGILGYMMKDQSSQALQATMKESMSEYNNNTDFKIFWDQIQGGFDCCGTDGPKDWAQFSKTPGDLPLTCCTKAQGSKGVMACSLTSPTLHQAGCLPKLVAVLKNNASTIGFTGIAIALIQLLGIIFSCKLAYSIRNSYESV